MLIDACVSDRRNPTTIGLGSGKTKWRLCLLTWQVGIPVACASRGEEKRHLGNNVVASVDLESRIRVSVNSANEHPMVVQHMTDHGWVIFEGNLNLGRTQHYAGVQPRIFLEGRFEKWEGIEGDLFILGSCSRGMSFSCSYHESSAAQNGDD